jgi:hypothetical protein
MRFAGLLFNDRNKTKNPEQHKAALGWRDWFREN